MLRYEIGCLIEAAKDGYVEIIAHQANCFNTMKSGIAPLIAEAFPEAWEADQATLRGDKSKLGTCSVGWNEEYCVDIFNLYGQYNYSRKGLDTEYDALRSALKAMLAHADFIEWEKPKVGLPKLGAGFGGGDWSIISKIIEEELKDHDVTIYVLDKKEIPND